MSDDQVASSMRGSETARGLTAQGGVQGKTAGSQTLARGLLALEAIAGQ
ncbi:hypothetical protein [Streptomyces cathayae]|uniref:Uncharacterized protein n=1 Tax=Streptomyces cathayae TaxID=3031124 RepID=A0ABY8JW99_9ACTN|nr:hypothetical protein [Streptomyces sp. HUAS 5]WGD39648.1 hypothetical protein PYS65_05580 [Streptomyces sp. HUAS 5]